MVMRHVAMAMMVVVSMMMPMMAVVAMMAVVTVVAMMTVVTAMVAAMVTALRGSGLGRHAPDQDRRHQRDHCQAS